MTVPSHRRLLTRQQVIAELRREREQAGLTPTAKKYGIAVQQLADVIADPPRKKLSRRLWEHCNYKHYEFFEKVDKAKGKD